MISAITRITWTDNDNDDGNNNMFWATKQNGNRASEYELQDHITPESQDTENKCNERFGWSYEEMFESSLYIQA